MDFATDIAVAGGGTICSLTLVTSIGWMQKDAKQAAEPPVAYGRIVFAQPSDIAGTRANRGTTRQPDAASDGSAVLLYCLCRSEPQPAGAGAGRSRSRSDNKAEGWCVWAHLMQRSYVGEQAVPGRGAPRPRCR